MKRSFIHFASTISILLFTAAVFFFAVRSWWASDAVIISSYRVYSLSTHRSGIKLCVMNKYFVGERQAASDQLRIWRSVDYSPRNDVERQRAKMFLGIGWSVVRYTGLDSAWQEKEISRAMYMPWWLLALLSLALPVRWFVQTRRRSALDDGAPKCERCGYDLRATPDRCPECGMVVAKLEER